MYIYSTDGVLANIDTLHIIDGYFEWETPLSEDATFYLVFPNMSELPVLASPGDRLKVTGNGSQLKSTRIEGSDVNKELTDFRLTHLNDALPDLRKALRAYIKANPNSRVSHQLQRQLTLLNATNSGVVTGRKLPQLDFPDDGISPYDSINSPQHPMLLVFWSGWASGGHDINAKVRRYLRDSVNTVTPVSISLDVEKNLYHYQCRQDTIDWTTRCYRRAWDTPQVIALSIRQLPYVILTDSTGTVVAHGSDWQADILPHL
ncbi:MAG: DUF4369 domain-containing protein [Bacteroidaceae bacterium]|nr:DUF4369 domain-containing protein [Bacteroidaceae bacterium]